AICKPRESPEGDSFVVNACLAKKGVDDWLVKQKYYCTSSRLGQQDCHHKGNCGLTARVSPTGHLWALIERQCGKQCAAVVK
ncbi:Protein naked cuticle 1, partial [Xenotaenia resolanae]